VLPSKIYSFPSEYLLSSTNSPLNLSKGKMSHALSFV
jgi:hypothetical protein